MERESAIALVKVVFLLGPLILTALVNGGWYSVAFFAALAFGGGIALILYRQRNGEL
jgi:hypothetical protein